MPPTLDKDVKNSDYDVHHERPSSRDADRWRNSRDLPNYMNTQIPKHATRIPVPGGPEPKNTLYDHGQFQKSSPPRSATGAPGFEAPSRHQANSTKSRPKSSGGKSSGGLDSWAPGPYHGAPARKEQAPHKALAKGTGTHTRFVASEVKDDEEDGNNGNLPELKDDNDHHPKPNKNDLAQKRKRHAPNLLSVPSARKPYDEWEPDPELRPRKVLSGGNNSTQDPKKTTFSGAKKGRKQDDTEERFVVKLKEAIRWPVHVSSPPRSLLLRGSSQDRDVGHLDLFVDSDYKDAVCGQGKSEYSIFYTDRDLISIRPNNRDERYTMNRWFLVLEDAEDAERLFAYFDQHGYRIKKKEKMEYEILGGQMLKESVHAKQHHPMPPQLPQVPPSATYKNHDSTKTLSNNDRHASRTNHGAASKKSQLAIAENRSERREGTGPRFSRDSPLPYADSERRKTRSTAQAASNPLAYTHPASPCRRPRQEWKEDLRYPFQLDKRGASINTTDLTKLDDDEFLNDEIVNFCLQYILSTKASPEMQEKVHLFNTFFFESFARQKDGEKNNYSRVARWTSKFDIFEKDYVIIPVNEQLHWYLAMFCNLPQLMAKYSDVPGGSAEKEAKNDEASMSPEVRKSPRISGKEFQDDSTDISSPVASSEDKNGGIQCVFIFDSLGSMRRKTITSLKEYLVQEATTKKGVTLNPKDIKGIHIKVPLQGNYSDCGLFLLHYVEQFLEHPEILREVLRKQNENYKFHHKELAELWNVPSSHDMRERRFQQLVDLKREHSKFLELHPQDEPSGSKAKPSTSGTVAGKELEEGNHNGVGNDSIQILEAFPSSDTSASGMLSSEPDSATKKTQPTDANSLKARQRSPELDSTTGQSQSAIPAVKPRRRSPEIVSNPSDLSRSTKSKEANNSKVEGSNDVNDEMDIDEHDKDLGRGEPEVRQDYNDEMDIDSDQEPRSRKTERQLIGDSPSKASRATLSHVEIPVKNLSLHNVISEETGRIDNGIPASPLSSAKDPGPRAAPLSLNLNYAPSVPRENRLPAGGHVPGFQIVKPKARRHGNESIVIPESPQGETAMKENISDEDITPLDIEARGVSDHPAEAKKKLERDAPDDRKSTRNPKTLHQKKSSREEGVVRGRDPLPEKELSRNDVPRHENRNINQGGSRQDRGVSLQGRHHPPQEEREHRLTMSSPPPSDGSLKQNFQQSKALQRKRARDDSEVMDSSKQPGSPDKPSPDRKRPKSLTGEHTPQVEVVDLSKDDDSDDDDNIIPFKSKPAKHKAPRPVRIQENPFRDT